MYPLNDNDLDRLSREAAEHYDVESSASGWEALENRLDRELPHKEDKDRRRFLFWLVFIAAITGGTLFWMLNNNTPAKDSLAQNKGQNKTVSSATTTENKSNSGNTAANTNTDASDNNNIAKKDTKATIAIPQEESGSAVKPITSNNTTSGKIAGNNKSGKTILASATRTNNGITAPRSRKGNKTGKEVTQNDINNNQPANDNTADVAVTKDKDANQPVANDPVATDKNIDKTATDKSKEEAKPATEETAKPKKAPVTLKKSNKGFELGLAAGPDLTNVKFKYFDKAGYIAGMQIGYRFNNRWSVNTGLFYTKKNYVAAAEDFNPPKHYWTTYVNLDKLDGNCSMWEVPLNVRYDFSTGKNQRWFASTGLSSYFMTQQYYEYYYYNQMGVLTKSNRWGNDSTYKHLFSIVNLSAGYERSIGKGFSIQAEPYFKVPLKGIGFGELKMESYGILFSLRYRIGQK